jgi:hypothetical protein
MNIKLLPNGNIEMSVDKDSPCQRRIKRFIKFFGGATYAAEAAFLADEFLCRASHQTYQQTAPCSIGALTSAACFTDGINVWADMNYQVQSFLEELGKGNKVIWQKG